ncbi:hypothetical protein GEMRC1_010820 [Eukaryota sp. GEM-RC1]
MSEASHCYQCNSETTFTENLIFGCCDRTFCSQSCHDKWMEEVIICPQCEELLDFSEADEDTRIAFQTEEQVIAESNSVLSTPHLSSNECEVLEDLEKFQACLQNELINTESSALLVPKLHLPNYLLQEVMLRCCRQVHHQLTGSIKPTSLYFKIDGLFIILYRLFHCVCISKRFLSLFQNIFPIFCFERTFSVCSASYLPVPVFNALKIQQSVLRPLFNFTFDQLFSNMFFDAHLRSVSSFPHQLFDNIHSLTLPNFAKFDFLAPHSQFFCRNLRNLAICVADHYNPNSAEIPRINLASFSLSPSITSLSFERILVDNFSIFEHQSCLSELTFKYCFSMMT